MVDTRPIIKLPLHTTDKLLEKIGLVVFVAMWIFFIFCYWQMPSIVPLHFNTQGVANRYGSKLTLLLLPILATLLYWGIGYLNKFPHIFNYMVTITEANAAKQYSQATRMLRWLKLAVLIAFSLTLVMEYKATIHKTAELNNWLLPFIYALFGLPTIWYIISSFSKKNK